AHGALRARGRAARRRRRGRELVRRARAARRRRALILRRAASRRARRRGRWRRPTPRSGTCPEVVARVLDDFVAAARDAFADDLVAIVLFGSAAEGALRATSD